MEWIVDSRILACGERRAMGRKDVCSFEFLFGLRTGIILAVFQEMGMIFELTILLKRLVMIVMD